MNIPLAALLIFVCGVIGLGAYQYFLIRNAEAIGQPLGRATVPYQQHPADATLHFLVAGDSTAVGVGAGQPKYSTAGKLGAQFPQADIVNIGVSGEDASQLAAKLASSSPDAHYDLALIQIGANDVVYFDSLPQAESAITSILDWSDAHASSTLILTSGNIGLSPVFTFPLAEIITARTKALRAFYLSEVPKHPHAVFVDLFDPNLNAAFAHDPAGYYAPDFFHPNAAGYALWYAKIQAALLALHLPENIVRYVGPISAIR